MTLTAHSPYFNQRKKHKAIKNEDSVDEKAADSGLPALGVKQHDILMQSYEAKELLYSDQAVHFPFVLSRGN